MDQEVPFGTSLLPIGSTTLWKKSAILCWRRRPPTGGGATSPYVEKGANRVFATRPRWENENSHSQHPGWRASGSPGSAGHPLEVDQGGGEDVEDDKL